MKPGAEKITVLLGLRSRFEIVGKVEDFEAGFFAYMVRCSLVAANGETITEGLGQANTKERKYARQDPYTLANTVLKMARKRALVDAALTVGSLSDIFTQDLEDADLAAEVREIPGRRSIFRLCPRRAVSRRAHGHGKPAQGHICHMQEGRGGRKHDPKHHP